MTVTKAEFPAGAIENGREFIRRIEYHYTFVEGEGHHLANCYEWRGLQKCFGHLADFAKHREDAERPLLERIKALEAENQKQAAEIERFRKRQLLGEASIQIVGELIALIPLKDTIRAAENRRAMVDYFRQALGETQ